MTLTYERAAPRTATLTKPTMTPSLDPLPQASRPHVLPASCCRRDCAPAGELSAPDPFVASLPSRMQHSLRACAGCFSAPKPNPGVVRQKKRELAMRGVAAVLFLLASAAAAPAADLSASLVSDAEPALVRDEPIAPRSRPHRRAQAALPRLCRVSARSLAQQLCGVPFGGLRRNAYAMVPFGGIGDFYWGSTGRRRVVLMRKG